MDTFCKSVIVVNDRIRKVSQAIFGGLLPPKNIDKLPVKEQLNEEIRLLKINSFKIILLLLSLL